jgi:ribosomal protein S13
MAAIVADINSKFYRDVEVKVIKIFYNEKGFVTCRVWIEACVGNAKAEGKEITCVGHFSPVLVGVVYEAKGMLNYVDKTLKNGRKVQEWQLMITSWNQKVSQSKQALISFLVQEVDGIGERRASEIYDCFKDKALETLRDDPLKISTVIHGITPERAVTISNTLKAKEADFRFKETLYGIGLTQGLISRLYAHYGIDVEKAIKLKTFDLSEVDGIGFKTCCLIADKLGIPKDRPDRVRAGTIYTLRDMMQMKGCTCIDLGDLVKETAETIGVSPRTVEVQVEYMLERGTLFDENHEFQDSDFEKEEEVSDNPFDDGLDDVIDPRLLKRGVDFDELRKRRKDWREHRNDKPADNTNSEIDVVPASVELDSFSESLAKPAKGASHEAVCGGRQGRQGRSESEVTPSVIYMPGPVAVPQSPPPPQVKEPELEFEDDPGDEGETYWAD